MSRKGKLSGLVRGLREFAYEAGRAEVTREAARHDQAIGQMTMRELRQCQNILTRFIGWEQGGNQVPILHV